MAIELHHLNTHGMMEQACDVLDGVVRLKERIAELEKENGELRSKNEGLLYALADAETDIAMSQRWRKFSEEKPKEKQWILVFNPNHSQFTTGIELRRWDNGCKYDVEFQELYEKWMPLPSAPKED